jgi:hypothetical protein
MKQVSLFFKWRLWLISACSSAASDGTEVAAGALVEVPLEDFAAVVVVADERI